MRIYLTLLITLVFVQMSIAQYDHEAVFADKDGVELNQLVVENFKPAIVLSYGQARDTMYGIIYNVQDSVAGIYSDHKVWLKPGEDPTTYLYLDGQPNGINAEHSYPQSKGAGSGNARSDMHHLFPSRVGTNSARGSFPFSEINDVSTDTWYFKNQENGATPASNKIDLYSEKGLEKWEPRESVKGNIARAIFYFYTMYKNQADSADPNFFEIQRETLCGWHDLDPVDQLEWERSKHIATWQDGKSNPFVLDCTLAARLFCTDVSPACQLTDINEELDEATLFLLGNPVQDIAIFEGAFAQKTLVAYRIINISTGQLVQSDIINKTLLPKEKYLLPLQNLPKGSYIVQWIVEDSAKGRQQSIPYKIMKQ